MSDLNSEITEWVAIAKGDKCPLCKGTGSIRGGQVTCPKCGGKKAIAKGDLPGHVFHGNQYSEAATDLARRVENTGGPMKWSKQADEHRGFAEEHRGLARQMTDALNRGEIPQERLPLLKEAIGNHLDAADLHDKAAKEAQDLTILDRPGGMGRSGDKEGDDYFHALYNAQNATDDALDSTRWASMSPEELGKSVSEIAKDADESLATILRHDQDHDNWHRMHGDEPCTSEADCAEKRAKYAEVKAELNKSADEMLAEIEQWREIQKGDVPGHPFHGNQYSENPHSPGETAFARRMGASWSAQMESAHARDMAQNGGTSAQSAYAHKGAAFEHRIAAQVLTNALERTTDPEKRGLLKAAIEAHTEAASLHDFATQSHESGSAGPYARDNSLLAHGASTAAAHITGLTGEDTGQEFR